MLRRFGCGGAQGVEVGEVRGCRYGRPGLQSGEGCFTVKNVEVAMTKVNVRNDCSVKERLGGEKVREEGEDDGWRRRREERRGEERRGGESVCVGGCRRDHR